MRFLMPAAVAVACVTGVPASASFAGTSPTSGAPIAMSAGDYGNSHIYTINSNGTALRKLTSGFDENPVWSPDRRSIAFVRNRLEGVNERGDDQYQLDLYVIGADGRGEKRVAKVASEADWSPNGGRLVLTHGYDEYGTLWTANADGSDAHRLVRGYHPDWSPDGRRIAFERWTGDFSEVFVMNNDGTNVRRLLRGHRREGAAPAWSPDGRRVAFFGAEHVNVVDVDGRVPTRLAPFWGETYNPPGWAPNGQRIAFAKYLDSRNSPDNDVIFVVSPSGTERAQRLPGLNVEDPEWSPDGRQIAFVRGDVVLGVMNADGSNVRRVNGPRPVRAIGW